MTDYLYDQDNVPDYLYNIVFLYRYSTDFQPGDDLSDSEKEALMGIVVRVDSGKTGAVEIWLNLVDQILIKAYMECVSKYAEEKGYEYPDDGPIFVNQRPDENRKLRRWAGTNGNRFPNFSLFEGINILYYKFMNL